MSCNIDYNLLLSYPEEVKAIFMSSAEDITVKTDNDKNLYIADNPVGYLIEMDRLAQASVLPGTTANNKVANNPYSTYLRPVTDMSIIFEAQKVMLQQLDYYAYDFLNTQSLTQDTDVINTIINSKSSDDAYAQRIILNSMVNVNWQPNYFRPSFKIDGRDVLQGIQATNYGNHRNSGDLSIGFPLPYCAEPYKLYNKPKRIEAFAGLAQAVNISADPSVPVYKYQRYGILLIATFRIGTGTVEVSNG